MAANGSLPSYIENVGNASKLFVSDCDEQWYEADLIK